MKKMLIAGLVAMMLVGCKTQERIVEVIKTDTLIVKDVQRDSVYVERHDSIVTNIQGDTVMVERWHWRDRWREREKHDTLYVAKHDTISQTITKTDVKEGKMSWWQRVRMTFGDIFLIILFCLVVVWAVKLYLKKVVRP